MGESLAGESPFVLGFERTAGFVLHCCATPDLVSFVQAASSQYVVASFEEQQTPYMTARSKSTFARGVSQLKVRTAVELGVEERSGALDLRQ